MVSTSTATSGRRAAGGDLAGGVDAAAAGHVQVHQHYVGAGLAGGAHSGGAVADLAGDADALGVAEGRAQALAE
jgi:hypothetical protein